MSDLTELLSALRSGVGTGSNLQDCTKFAEFGKLVDKSFIIRRKNKL